MFLNNFHCILLNYTSALQHQDLSCYLLVCYLFVMQSVKAVQFLNIACLLFPSSPRYASVVLAPTIFIFLVTSIYASL